MIKFNMDGEMKNKYWKTRWEDIISRDDDSDYEYLMRLILHKLDLMLEYYENPDGNPKKNLNKESLNNIINSLKEALRLGELCESETDENCDKFLAEHCKTTFVLVDPTATDQVEVCTYAAADPDALKTVEAFKKKHPEFKKYYVKTKSTWDNAESADKYEEIWKNSSLNKEAMFKNFFNYIGEHIMEWWY